PVDDDSDGDGVPDDQDDCPDDPNGWVDSNNDGVCDDLDDNDGDGIPNGEEKEYGADCSISDPNNPDSDNDGKLDPDDLYPLDPFPEYILFRNDLGTIDLMLSNGDGTFTPPVEVGELYGGSGDSNYRYISFVISDFDNNGQTDFLAIGDIDPQDPGNLLDLWWFPRVNDPQSFIQYLIDDKLDRNIFGTTADIGNDDLVDLVALEQQKPNYISNAWLYSYTNMGIIADAVCAYTMDPLNPEGCAFHRQLAVDITAWSSGQWIVRQSYDAVDVNQDGNRDIVLIRHANGGNSAIPVTLLAGNGDGTFAAPGAPIFTHNQPQSGQSPANSMLFADFDNDKISDLMIGLDDDGDAGSAWFYPGQNQGNYSWNLNGAFESFDLNPAAENGGEHFGVTGSAQSFDFDFDGNEDIMLGYNYTQPWAPPSQTVYLGGKGDGTFNAPAVIRQFPNSSFAQNFAIPKRICQPFLTGG
ncbi:MAG: VCBS repeat-containing protein, partial [Myxococcales bacterium]|nr:VCBS repeat-containing protein [Myxococcales bacterium]